MDIQQIKQRFGIIGNSPGLNRAIEVANQVAPTEISALILGQSGVGKEIMPQIIHHYSARKHGKYIAVNCGAIPEGTIDSELFGHEKGAFTGATDSRKGYFEVADGGTIFLDEVAELPLQTQVRLLRVLETGEFIRVGSSKVQKTNVRIVAATNENMQVAISKGKFREDLFYRLSTVPIYLPALKDRKEDIHLLFRKFSTDFADKYKMPPIRLNPEAVTLLENYSWPGNIRQLKNVAEQMSVIESARDIDPKILSKYLPEISGSNLPSVINKEENTNFSEREILYKVLFDMKKDITDMKKIILDLLENSESGSARERTDIIDRLHHEVEVETSQTGIVPVSRPSIVEQPKAFQPSSISRPEDEDIHHHEEVEESLSLVDKEIEMIKKALKKHRSKRKYAAQELGISERTLYRKIKEHNISE